MSYTYEDYVNYYKYYYGDQYGTYYAQQAAAAAGVAPPGGAPAAAAQPAAGVMAAAAAAVAQPPTTTSHYSYPPPAAGGAPAKHSTAYPPPGSYNPRPSAGGHSQHAGAPIKRGWGGEGERHGGREPHPKKPKKPPVPSVTCAICDVTVSSEQVYQTHIAGKAHKKRAEKMKKDEADARRAQEKGLAAKTEPAVAAVAAVGPPGTGVIISGGNAGAQAAVSVLDPTPPKKAKARNKPNKKRKGFGLVSSDPAEQQVFQCELCNVTVNSQQQLDLHLTGIKHKKTVKKNANSADPEVQRKLKECAEMAKQAEENKAASAAETASAEPPITEETAPQPNLPPGYVFIPASQAASGKDTFLCSVCNHYSSDLFSLNAHVSSAEHQSKAAKQEKPLGGENFETLPAPTGPAASGATQAKLVGQKTNFNLGARQTANANSWNANKVQKKITPLSSSFVAAGGGTK